MQAICDMALNALIDNETDDLLHDDDIRNASRTFRQTFDVPSSERLVNCKYHVSPTAADHAKYIYEIKITLVPATVDRAGCIYQKTTSDFTLI